MNAVDWVIVGIIGVSVLFGLYRGFIASVASMAGSLLSLGGSYLLTPKAVDWVKANTGLRESIASWIDVPKLIGDKSLSELSVNAARADDAARASIVSKVPKPLDSLLDNAIKSAGDVGQNVGEYVQNHLVDAAMNVICFIGCFLALMLLSHLIIVLLKTIFKFPVLKQMNTVAGGLFGLLRGALICFVLFAAVPLIQAVISSENMGNVNELVENSTLAPMFNNGTLIESIMNIKI